MAFSVESAKLCGGPRRFEVRKQEVYQLVEVIPRTYGGTALVMPYGAPGTRDEALRLQKAIEKERAREGG